MRRRIAACGWIVLLQLGLSGAVGAQWSDDPAVNLALADAAGEQIQAKIVARPGGGYYVSWFDNRTGGYDVYVQRLDENGVEQWAHNGVLIADRGFSSTQDYGLAADTSGNALLVFRDDRFSGTQITAAMVDSTGTLVWGAAGVQLTDTMDFVAAPKVAGTSDGEIVVGWKQDVDVYLQRLDAAGAAVWANPSVIQDAMSRDYSLSDLRRSDAGSVIAAMVFQPSGFLGPKHLHAQKISSLGTAQWGAVPVAVFDGGSLQFGNFPTFVSDGSGGAVFSWYDTSASLECYVQRVDSSGAEVFPHDGLDVSSSARDHVDPDVAYDPVSGSVYVVWSEVLPGPTPDYAIYGQRFDSAGVKQWGSDGVAIAALGTTEVRSARIVLDGSAAMAFWVRSPGATVQTIHAVKLDAGGATVWMPATLDVATAASGKSRLFAERGSGFAVLSWTDDRAGNNDVYVQNVNVDGTLGASAAGPGAVAGLLLARGPGASEVTLTWSASCSAGADYGVFEGTLTSLRAGVYDHVPVVCTDAAPVLEEALTAAGGDAYYLVVPVNASAEGSHGMRRDDGSDSERPVGAGQCAAIQTLGCP